MLTRLVREWENGEEHRQTLGCTPAKYRKEAGKTKELGHRWEGVGEQQAKKNTGSKSEYSGDQFLLFRPPTIPPIALKNKQK